MKLTTADLSPGILTDSFSLQREPLHLQIRDPIAADAFSILMLAAMFSRAQYPALIDVAGNAFSPAAQDSYSRSFLAPLFLRDIVSKEKREVAPDSVMLNTSSVGPGTLLIPPQALVCLNPKEFQRLLSQALRDAAVVVPSHILGLIASIGFEATLNAEEHGTVRLDAEDSEVFRAFGLVHHRKPSALHPAAAGYVQQYETRYRAPEHGWVEIMVVDAGMGLSFPSFYIHAKSLELPSVSVYDQPIGVELMTLQKMLRHGQTTKGWWGNLITTQTQPGAGTDNIRKRLAIARGYAALRTGRCRAEWSFIKAAAPALGAYNLKHYESQPVSPPALFEGTAWHFLIPLTLQAELPLYD